MEAGQIVRQVHGIAVSKADQAQRSRNVPVSPEVTRALSRSSAMALFCIWLRSRVHLTAMPVGTWRMRTAVSTLFTFWPPAPPDRMVVISRSLSGISISLTSSPVSSSFGTWGGKM